jgi:hypothetical protein
MATTKKVLEIEIDVDSGDVKKLNKEIGNTKKEVKATSQSTSGLTSQLDKMTGGAISGLKGMLTGVKSLITGFKTMKFAIAATGIGALIISVAALGAAFTSSEEGQNKFAKIMGVIGAITGNLVDLLADLGEKMIWAFENPQQALEDFGNLIKENLINRFEGLMELIPQLGKAIGLLFEGEFSEAGKVALNAVAKVSIGVEDITGKIEDAIEATKEFIEENIKEGEAAAKVADMRAKADKIERKLIVERSKLESEIALLRLKSREEDKFTAEERKQALLDAQKLEDELLDKETKYLELRRNAQVLENTFSRTNKENLTKEAEAIAAVNRQVAARANTARQLQRELNTINGQIEAEEKARQAEILRSEKEIRDIIAGWDKEDAANKKQADQDKLEADKMLTSLKISNMEEGVAKELALNQAKHDALREQAKGNAEILTEIDIAQAAKVAKIEEEAAAKKKANEQAAADATVAVATATIGSLSALNQAFSKDDEKGRREAFKREKALGIASAVINTAKSAVSAYNSMAGIPFVGPVLAPIAAVAAIAAGAAQIKNITKQKYKGESGGGGGGGASGLTASGGGSAPSAPQFNTVGTSGFNQINESLNNNNRNPTKAYVVSGEVSSAQSLDRNRIKEATFP